MTRLSIAAGGFLNPALTRTGSPASPPIVMFPR